MYERAIERLGNAGLMQYEISNFGRPGFHSLHNLRYWHRRPYLGVGLDASSALFAVDADHELRPLLRAKTTDDLKEYLAGPRGSQTAWIETAWMGRVQQHEEAWFLGLRLNGGVDRSELEQEFGDDLVRTACQVAQRLALDGLLEFDGHQARLTPRGRLLSNEVFQEFLGETTSQQIS
jgi:oxygen-independent coproporphyrinogen-3 oxidase